MPATPAQLVASWITDLIYLSETEAPLMVLLAGTETELLTALQQATGKPIGKLEKIGTEAFFEKVLRQQRIILEEDPAASQLERWSALERNLLAHFSTVEVYRSGSVLVDIFMVCRIEQGHCVVIVTRAVET